jgi:Peptidase C65 Otubain
MDRSDAPDGGWHHDFLVDGEPEPKLFFLYRPGHYDILYKPEDVSPSSTANNRSA